MLAERGAVLQTTPSCWIASDAMQWAFFHLPGPVRDILLKTQQWSLDDLDLDKASVRKELLASWNADAYRWLRENRPETLGDLKAKDVEGTALYGAFYEGKSGRSRPLK